MPLCRLAQLDFVFFYVGGSQEELVHLQSQSLVQMLNTADRAQMPFDHCLVARYHECQNFGTSDEVLDHRTVFRQYLLHILNGNDADSLQRNGLGIVLCQLL